MGYKTYLSGPMSGQPFFNGPAFNEAAKKLRKEGHSVCNPVEQDKKRDGKDWGNLVPDGCPTKAKLLGFNRREALLDDLTFICREAEAIALLPGWERSKGARAERAVARALGLKVLVL